MSPIRNFPPRLASAITVVFVVRHLPFVLAGPLITEFMADNDTVLDDEDGEFSDWVEIHNRTPPLSI